MTPSACTVSTIASRPAGPPSATRRGSAARRRRSAFESSWRRRTVTAPYWTTCAGRCLSAASFESLSGRGRSMEPKLHRRVQRYGWDLAVQDYDQYFVPLLRHCSERCLEMAALQPGERVLDVATGTGVAAFLVAERVGPQGEVVATDISQRMVDAVREEAERRGVTNMSYERVDAEELGFADGSFDAAPCV